MKQKKGKEYKRKLTLIVSTVILSLVLSNCPEPEVNQEPGENQEPENNAPSLYAAEFRGEWIRIDNGDLWYIKGNQIKAGSTVMNQSVTLARTSENVITATTAGGQRYTLFAARVADAGFNAKVVILDESTANSSAVRSITDIIPPVKIKNPEQPDMEITVTPDALGVINVPGVIPGDRVEIIPQSDEWSNITVGITPGYGNEQNMGTIPLTHGDNFKVSLRMANPAANDMNELYADMVPRGYILELENIGTTHTGEVGWEIEWDSGDYLESSSGIIDEFANIPPGTKKQRSLTLTPKTIGAEETTKNLITIKMMNYDSVSKRVREWEDSVSVKYYNVPVSFNIKSEKKVQGVIKAGNGKSYYFSTARTGTTGDFAVTKELPWSNDEYTIVFLGADVAAETATKYSFGINADPPTNWSSLSQFDFLREYKPDNEFEETAPVINLATGERTFMGYLAGNSIDYYKIALGSTPPPPRVGTVTYNTNEADDGTAPAPVTRGFGASITLPGQESLEREGYVFDGWNTNADGSGTTYAAGASYTVTGNVTLYAKWELATNTYTITFNANGAASGTAPATMSANQNASITLPGQGSLTRTGYIFNGWNTAANGGGTTYAAGSSYTVTGNVTLYVIWIPIIEMVQINLGTFARNGYTITLTSGFYMGKYEVTQEQYQAVMGNNPSDSSNPASGEIQGRRPVENVRWYDAIVFCNKLSMAEGLTAAYSINGSTDPAIWGTVPTSSNATWNAAQVVAGSTGYRLPTEAQWEYACRAGTTTTWSFGNNESGLTNYAWYSGNSSSMTHEVGKKLPNAWGLYDMHGNVWEWCWDWYGSLPYTAQTDPTGAVSGSYRLIRGGGCGNLAEYTASAYRNNGYNFYGFRIVRP
ncbi:MAG: SUMF1/EgtB/PvdO family nonheme iron enzyme [Treponema sp.]|jgi:uncharacterized repeat protein (TIGR02543 family)|nr:SUMF1/EgtB/PvdO family nonheme iron enzyme [Treponema sp.]